MAIGALSGRNEPKDYVIIPPDGGWGWVVVFAAFYCQFVIDGIQLSFGMILNEIALELDEEKSKVVLIGSLAYGVHLLMGPLCAALSRHYGERVLVIAGSILASVGLATGYFKPPLYVLYLGVGILSGTGLCFMNMNSIVMATLYFSSKRIIALGIVVCGTGIGTIVFAAGANAILKTMHWHEVCLIEAAMAFSAVFAGMLFRPLTPVQIVTATDIPNDIVERYVDDDESDDESNKSLDDGHSRKRIFYVGKKDMLQHRSHSQATILDHTDQVLEQVAASFITTETDPEKGFRHCCKRAQKLFCPCCPKHRRKRMTIVMTPKAKESFLKEGSAEGIHEMTEAQVVAQEGHQINNCARMWSVMLDCNLLKDWKFFVFCVSGAFGAAALIIVFFYEKVRLLEHGASEDEAMLFVMSLGIFNTVWRLFLGALSVSKKFKYHFVNISGVCIGGIFTMLSGLSHSAYYTYTYGAFYGLAIACFAVFHPVMVSELVPLDEVSNATGLCMLFMGGMSIIGAPFAGWMMEIYEDYDVIFYIGGGMMLLSGLLLLPIRESSQQQQQNH